MSRQAGGHGWDGQIRHVDEGRQSGDIVDTPSDRIGDVRRRRTGSAAYGDHTPDFRPHAPDDPHRTRRAVTGEGQARALSTRPGPCGPARWQRCDWALPTPRASWHGSAAPIEPHAWFARGKGLQTAPVRKTGTQQTLYLFSHRSAPFFRGRAVARQITITRHIAALRTFTRDRRDDQPDPTRCQTMVESHRATERGCRNGAR